MTKSPSFGLENKNKPGIFLLVSFYLSSFFLWLSFIKQKLHRLLLIGDFIQYSVRASASKKISLPCEVVKKRFLQLLANLSPQISRLIGCIWNIFIVQWKTTKSRESFHSHTDKKENHIFLMYKEIQSGAVAKSYRTNGLLKYWEIFAHFHIY